MINYFSSQSVSSFQGLVKTSNGILCLLPSDGLFLQSKVKCFLIPQSILVFKINFIKEENRSFSFNNFLRTEIRIAVILWFLLPVPFNTIKKPYTFFRNFILPVSVSELDETPMTFGIVKWQPSSSSFFSLSTRMLIFRGVAGDWEPMDAVDDWMVGLRFIIEGASEIKPSCCSSSTKIIINRLLQIFLVLRTDRTHRITFYVFTRIYSRVFRAINNGKFVMLVRCYIVSLLITETLAIRNRLLADRVVESLTLII